jgi:hypothetical protein
VSTRVSKKKQATQQHSPAELAYQGSEPPYHATFQNPVITPRFEIAIVSADGAEHIIEISYNFLTHNSTRTAMISTIRDITAFKRLEQQERRTHHAALRADIGQALTERSSLQHTLQRCCKALVHHVPVDLARIWTLNNQQQVLELQASSGCPAHLGDEDRSIPLGDPRVVRLLHRREPLSGIGF